ncbi:2-succinyl-6-hydroxy-2,4-cyclohexadiene-1-carboxylate synthase [Psychromonas sp. CD1]|uniref:2-succinyl-6-hydroxy-2, 4-cyclohexadiene-1-carboxylate synthase n=1 Tax=Psychromonas sp. CD1 TaxID=1979839 RepID=UPI000B9A89F2|nr:2-succinyl-6-hydroxy-2,4-cyclohexadiene-1-carboxylate synthase [Psychromonas sp. CD1]
MPLFSQQYGDSKAPTLIFLHGFLGNSHDWEPIIAHLKHHFHCVCIDLPGHGKSIVQESADGNGFTHSHRLINDVISQLKIQNYSFIGYSMGGRIALDYARTQKDKRLKRLFLESTHNGLSSSSDKEQRFIHDVQWAKRFATDPLSRTINSWYEQDIFKDLSHQEKKVMVQKRINNYGVPLAAMLLATSLGKQQDTFDFLQKTHLPIYYLFGEKDTKFKEISLNFASTKYIKRKEFIGSGHNIHLYNPLQYANFIIQCFNKNN